MGETTNISWTDSTFNPWIGCTKVSPGCDNCYAEAQDHRWGHDSWGKGKPRRMTSDANWRQPLKWNHNAFSSKEPWRVFCASLADVMDDEAPEGGRERLWDLIDRTPFLTWQLLTKRPQRYLKYLPEAGFRHKNVWLGTTCEDQKFYDVRWPVLREVCGVFSLVSWISYEPALGPLTDLHSGYLNRPYPDWLICGGESGAGFRPMDPKWAVDIRGRCQSLGIKFFMKQMSALTPTKGKELVPIQLQIHEFPA